jgi:hypothetical protein
MIMMLPSMSTTILRRLNHRVLSRPEHATLRSASVLWFTPPKWCSIPNRFALWFFSSCFLVVLAAAFVVQLRAASHPLPQVISSCCNDAAACGSSTCACTQRSQPHAAAPAFINLVTRDTPQQR